MSAWKPEEGMVVRFAPPPLHRITGGSSEGLWELTNERTGQVILTHEETMLGLYEPAEEPVEEAPAVPLELRRMALDYALGHRYELSSPEHVIEAAKEYLQFLLDEKW